MKKVELETLAASSTFDGAKRVTCKEAARLLENGKAWKAYFRPDGVLSHVSKVADNDVAFVWLK